MKCNTVKFGVTLDLLLSALFDIWKEKSIKTGQLCAISLKHPFKTIYERSFQMKYDPKEFEKYPDVMTKEQMRIACHISKQTALYLLKFNLIPHTYTGKKTRCYAIKKCDIIAFMKDREQKPNKYKPPQGWYSYRYTECPLYLQQHPPASSPKQMRGYYKKKLRGFPDVMAVAEAAAFTGYSRHTVGEWIRKGKVRPLVLMNKYMIPKCYLIDWLCSEEYNRIRRKSGAHIDILLELQKSRGKGYSKKEVLGESK